MKYWITTTEDAANTLDQIILLLGSRALALRSGYQRDEDNRVIGRNLRTGVTQGAATEHWFIPAQTVAGGWAVLSPEESDLYANTYSDMPAVLAVGWGLDPASVNWASVIAAANAAGASLDSQSFNPAVEVTMPAVAWVAGACAVVGVAYVEATDPAFPTFDGI